MERPAVLAVEALEAKRRSAAAYGRYLGHTADQFRDSIYGGKKAEEEEVYSNSHHHAVYYQSGAQAAKGRAQANKKVREGVPQIFVKKLLWKSPKCRFFVQAALYWKKKGHKSLWKALREARKALQKGLKKLFLGGKKEEGKKDKRSKKKH